MSQYFENDKDVISDPRPVTCWCGDRLLRFSTDHGVFSYGEIDDASLKLVRLCRSVSGDVLDLGCGYGFIGIYLKTKYPEIVLYQSDINERALELCTLNASENDINSKIIRSDSFESIDGFFNHIFLNPPIHAGKDICNELIDASYTHLKPEGSLYLVIRKKHGAEGYISRFENMEYKYSVLDKKDGIYVLMISK